MCDAEDLALHLALAISRHQREPRLQRLHHVARIHALRHSNRRGRRRRSCGRKQRKAQRHQSRARSRRIHLCVVDQRDAAFFQIAFLRSLRRSK